MENVRLYQTEAAFDADETRYIPCVSYIVETDRVDYELPTDYAKECLTLNILSAGTIHYSCQGGNLPITISYSTNKGSTWTSITSSIPGTDINVNAGDKVMLKGTNSRYGSNNTSIFNTFSGSTAYFDVEGNIMSLISGDSFVSATKLSADYTFYGLFGFTNAVHAHNLIIPTPTLRTYSYANLFDTCQHLLTAPSLSAITSTYSASLGNMFQFCTSLTEAADMSNVNTIYDWCCSGMYLGCTGLTKAVIKATQLKGGSCYNMFSGCTSLNDITCLATSIGTSATNGWTTGVAATGTFTKAANMSNWPTGVNGIPTNWTVQDYTN